MDEEGLVKAGIMKKMQPLQRKKGKTTLTSRLLSALLHLQSLNLPGSQVERSLCNILSEHQNIRK